jgi:hypothetical protein
MTIPTPQEIAEKMVTITPVSLGEGWWVCVDGRAIDCFDKKYHANGARKILCDSIIRIIEAERERAGKGQP